MDMLDKIIEVKRKEIEQLKKILPQAELQERAKNLWDTLDFKKAIDSRECAIIAEVKKHSPSKGSLREDADPCAVAALYEKNGAAAISVLTDRLFFHGSPEYLIDIKKIVQIPVLRKDFVIDAYQIYETRLMGADALLLIAGILSEKMLREYIQITKFLSMSPLVEVHSREELDIAIAAGAEIIGINNRDLKTFTTDIKTTIELAPLVPAGTTLISESGIKNRNDIEILKQAGVHAFLVGETLMLASDPGRKLRELAGAEAIS
jgi:indole-3-glycerol phosphate synthase